MTHAETETDAAGTAAFARFYRRALLSVHVSDRQHDRLLYAAYIQYAAGGFRLGMLRFSRGTAAAAPKLFSSGYGPDKLQDFLLHGESRRLPCLCGGDDDWRLPACHR